MFSQIYQKTVFGYCVFCFVNRVYIVLFVQHWNHWFSCCFSLCPYLWYRYSSPLLIRPSFLQWQSGLIRGVVFLGRDNLVVFYNISVYMKFSLIRGVAIGGRCLIKRDYCTYHGEYVFTIPVSRYFGHIWDSIN